MNKKKILLSAGFNKSHLISVAGVLNQSKTYNVYLISSLYPKLFFRKILKILAPYNKAIHRFLDRRENLQENKVFSIPISEIISKISSTFINKEKQDLKYKIESLGINYYANKSTNILKKVKPSIFHYRSCYGLNSLNYTKSRNIISICDHTIFHPRFLWKQLHSTDYYIDPFSSEKLKTDDAKSMNNLYKLMEYDLENAENILVNSDIVKKTCVFYGIAPNIIKVIYLGCDDKFLSYSNEFRIKRKARLEILYVGAWTKRKGVFELIKALENIEEDITLNIVGASYTDVKSLTPNIFRNKIKINIYGYVNRDRLSKIYSAHQIVIIPSLAEGSARVGFEALACGCFVITTPYSGTIVKNNINGFLFEAGNIKQLELNILKALGISNKEIKRIMYDNYWLIRTHFTSEKYFEKLHGYYEYLESNS